MEHGGRLLAGRSGWAKSGVVWSQPAGGFFEERGRRMKVVVNRCFGGFGLSDAAYRKLIEWGIPCRKYAEEERDPKTGLYTPVPENEGLVIFDHELTPQGDERMNDLAKKYDELKRAMHQSYDVYAESARDTEILKRLFLKRQADLDRFEREHPELALASLEPVSIGGHR
jgi:hypothetical protein